MGNVSPYEAGQQNVGSSLLNTNTQKNARHHCDLARNRASQRAETVRSLRFRDRLQLPRKTWGYNMRVKLEASDSPLVGEYPRRNQKSFSFLRRIGTTLVVTQGHLTQHENHRFGGARGYEQSRRRELRSAATNKVGTTGKASVADGTRCLPLYGWSFPGRCSSQRAQ